MTQQIAVPDDIPPANPNYGDAFVVFAVTVVSCAIGAWMLLRVGLELWAGSATALCIYAALLLFHLLVRRSLAAPAPPPAAPLTRRKIPAESKARQPPPAEPPLAEPPAPKAPGAPQRAKLALPPDTPPATDPPPQSRGPSLFDFRPAREPSLPPAAPRVPLQRAPAKEAKPAPAAPSHPPSPLDASQPEISLDFVEESIKKLADALNTAAANGRAEPAPESAGPNEADVDRSIAALRTAARTMKAPAGRSMAPATPAPDAAPPLADRRAEWWPSMDARRVSPAQATGAPPVNPRLARLTEAVAAERMEVLLEPIHALTEGRPRHFEVSMRLLAADGTTMEQDEYTAAAREAGLMPRLDAAKMLRAARVAGRLGQRGREGAVLTSLATDSIIDRAFLELAAARPRGAGGMGLVLSFAQSEVRAFTPAHARALADLTAVGFRFGLREVTDLDMDFAALSQMGFVFVELDAPVFLEGLPAPGGGHVPAADITRHLSDFGLSLIVGRIEDDWLLARVLGFGVVFGKGGLFGGPGRVKDEVVAPSSAA